MALRAPAGSGGALGKEGEEGLSGLPGGRCAVARVASRWSPAAAADARRDTQMAFGGLGLEMIREEDARRGLGLSQR